MSTDHDYARPENAHSGACVQSRVPVSVTARSGWVWRACLVGAAA